MSTSNLPEEGEFVVCTAKSIQKFGVDVTLDEYPNLRGFIHITEVSSGWIKRIRDFVRENQKIVAKVIHVEKLNNMVTLSLKQVNEHQRREKIKLWKNENKAKKLFNLLAERLGMSVDECYEKFGNRLINTYDGLYGAFEKAVISPETFKKKYNEDWVEQFISIAEENIVLSQIKISGYLELTCSDSNGIECIKKALMMGEKVKGVSITYISAPRYRITVTAPNYKIAEKKLARAVEKIIDCIESYNGKGEFHRT